MVLKRTIPLVILEVLLVTLLMLSFNTHPVSCATIFSQNFDEEPTGSVPPGWIVKNPEICSLEVNEAVRYGDSGKSARYADLSYVTASYVGTTFSSQNDLLELEFALRAEIPEYLMVYVTEGSSVYGANIYFTPYGRFAYYDYSGWHYLRAFSINTWYRIKMVIDIPANTYDIYIDDLLEVTEAHFRGFGAVTQLNTIHFGGNSREMPVGYIDEISVSAIQPQLPQKTPLLELVGGVDYLSEENVRVRLAALVKDANTTEAISDANVTIEIYYPNGSLWVSDKMIERLVGTGIYEWESNETIYQMNLEKGVYLVHVRASVGNAPVASDILLFHIDRHL